MSRKEQNIFKLKQLKNLNYNWNGYGAGPISSTIIDTSIGVIKLLNIQPSVFPTARNSIQLEYEKINGDYLEFELFENKVELYSVENSKEVESEFKIEEINWNDIVDEFIND